MTEIRETSRWFACGMAFCLLARVCAAVEFAGGTGEPNDPYQIATAEQLTGMGNDTLLYGKHFVLMADIDLDPGLPGGRVFSRSPIAPARVVNAHVIYVDCYPFGGTFDGRGRTIRNLTVHAAEDVNGFVGLFGAVTGRVRNLRLEGVSLSGGWRVGGVTGYNQGTITACRVSGTIAGDRCVGGVAGLNEGAVNCCCAAGMVSGDNMAGGLVGLHRAGTVAFSYSVARVDGNLDVGGLIGASEYGAVYLSYWDLDITRVRFSAGGRAERTHRMMDRELYRGWGYPGLWGLAHGADYPRFLWEGRDGEPIVDPSYTYGGGTGAIDDPFEIRSAEQLISLGYRPGDFNDCFVLTADIDLGGIDPNVFVPIGTPRWPFAGQFEGNGHVISNFACSREGLTGVGLFGCVRSNSVRSPDGPFYRRTPGTVTNVLLEDVVIRGGNSTGALAGVNEGRISACGATGEVAGVDRTGGLVGHNRAQVIDCHYGGSVDGNDCTGGLCGYSESSGVYSGGLQACSAAGAVRGNGYVGGLAGKSNAGLISCHTDNQVVGVDAVGGLAGQSSQGIRDSYSTSTVTGRTRVGGLVGNNCYEIERCTCSGDVLGENTVGGLVGSNSYPIRSSYAMARVSGRDRIGGLIGYQWRGAVTYCYSAGVVVGDGNDVGGLVGGEYDRGEFLLCYWDTDVSGLTSSRGGFGRPRWRMQQARTFRGWKATDWTLREGEDYPRLAWERKAGQPLQVDLLPYGGGTGDPNDPYHVWTARQFVEIAYRPTDYKKCFVLMADIDLGAMDRDEIIPIGSAAAPFLGRFDGNGHTLTGFRCRCPGSPCIGVFGVVGWIGYSWQKPANVIETVENLRVVDANLVGGEYTGGLAGIVAGRIEDSSVAGRVEGTDYTGGVVGSISSEMRGVSWKGEVRGERCVGGLAGLSRATIADCISSGVVSGRQQTGGAAGFHEGVLVSCVSTCTVEASGPEAGGLVGKCYGPVTDCHAVGDVSGAKSVGGLIGSSHGDLRRCSAAGQMVADGNAVGGLVGDSWGYQTAIAVCSAAGLVRGRNFTGGLVGSCRASVTECCSWADVTGMDRVGGLLGMATEPVVSSYARGIVTGRDYVGGLIGYDWSPVSKCYSTGHVSGGGQFGTLFVHGLLGIRLSDKIESCFWDVQAFAADAGRFLHSGVTAKTAAEMQTAATFVEAGWDFEDTWTICEGRDYPRLRWEVVDCEVGP